MGDALAHFQKTVCAFCNHNPKCKGIELIECLLTKINSPKKEEGDTHE